MKKLSLLTFSVFMASLAGIGMAQGASLTLDDSMRCGAGNATNGIQVTDVSGAVECWGAFDGNTTTDADPILYMGMTYTEVAKEDTPGGPDAGAIAIGLDVTPDGGAPSGTWEITGTFNPTGNFLLVLKAASMPGFGVWEMPSAQRSGDWFVAWGRDLSHLSIYTKDGGGTPGGPPGEIPEPGTLLLLGSGLAGLGLWRWNQKK